jgi:hypothetical protein
MVKTLKGRNTEIYGEDIPLSKNLISSWMIEKIESCGKEAKMECYKDPQPAGEYDITTLVFGGKVLVIDIVIKVFNAPSISPRVELSSIKSSLATSHSTSNSSLSPETVDRLLFETLNKYVKECQKPPLVQNCVYARSIRNVFTSHLRQLNELDRMTMVKEDLKVDGISWLEEVGSIGKCCEEHALREATSMRLVFLL